MWSVLEIVFFVFRERRKKKIRVEAETFFVGMQLAW
jgi:hypothetical protein